MNVNEKEAILISKGYDCRGMLTLFENPIKYAEWQAKDMKNRADLIYEPASEESIRKFIEDSFDLVIKHTHDKPLKIVNACELPSNLEAHIPATKPRREPDSLNLVNRF